MSRSSGQPDYSKAWSRMPKPSLQRVSGPLLMWIAALIAAALLMAVTGEGRAAAAGGVKKKVLSGTLDSNGTITIKAAEIGLAGINLAEPNFLVTAYVQPTTYWVTSRVFINADSISLETSRTFAGKKYKIIIVTVP